MSTESQIQNFRQTFDQLRQEIGKIMVGHTDIVEGTLTAIFAGGHVLLEGVPGLAKTLTVRTLAETIDTTFSRIQFTPDLLPADVVGPTPHHRAHGFLLMLGLTVTRDLARLQEMFDVY